MLKNIIGIMGGTFNPIHKGHISIAVTAHEQFNIPKILVMPSRDPSSYKNPSEILPAEQRCDMIKLSIKDYDYMELSEIEIKRPGPTFTSDTLKFLYKKYDEIFFIIGADSLFAIDSWHEHEYVMTHCHLICAGRNNVSDNDMHKRIEFLKTKYNAVIDLLKTKELPYSSTDIRNRITNNKSIHGMVTDSVEDYIHKNHLYR